MVKYQFFIALIFACVSARAAANEPKFFELKPLRAANPTLPPTLRDIESHLLPTHDLRNEDEITWGHEGTHYIDARLSLRPVRTFYCLRNRVVRIKSPKISMAQIAAAVPPPLRGRIYEHYLVTQAKYWDDQPLYIVHEWTAYTHGAQIRKELKWDKRGETEKYMAEMGVYVAVLVELTERLDPDYDLEPLVAFVQWNAARGREIAEDRWIDLPAFKTAAELPYVPAVDLMNLNKE